MDHRPRCEMWNYKTPRRDNLGKNQDDLGYDDDFLDTVSKGSIHERNNW